jgi:hypothetical protein
MSMVPGFWLVTHSISQDVCIYRVVGCLHVICRLVTVV